PGVRSPRPAVARRRPGRPGPMPWSRPKVGCPSAKHLARLRRRRWTSRACPGGWALTTLAGIHRRRRDGAWRERSIRFPGPISTTPPPWRGRRSLRMAKKTTKAPESKNTDVFGREVDPQEVERFLARVKELGLGSHDLAGRVRELFEDLADS